MTLSNDAPINGPKDDLYSLDPFAKAVASAIESMDAPDGLVLAINGPWGSGKSSAINLIRGHLTGPMERGEIVLVPFNPWWFAGADALTLAFFQELGVAIGPSLPEQVRKSLARIGGSVSAIGAVVGAAANLKVPGLGKLIEGATSAFGKAAGTKRTVEQEHAVVAKALKDQKRRFLVIIDDIDRLNPDDALTIFRLVKSVGRLPNVIYLLSFDRALAERAVAERFPSEGPSYLEKIVQSAFDVPPPLVDLLRNRVLSAATEIMGSPSEAKVTRFMNVFYDVVAPFLKTPRDVVRLENDLRATWPAVAGEVDRADFLALSSIKLSKPDLYRAIREHPDELCDAARDGMQRPKNIGEIYDNMLGLDANSPDHQQLRRAMMRLFPRLESIWGNTYYGGERHNAARQIAARRHFPTYFAYSLGDDILPTALIDEVIARADDGAFVQSFFRERLKLHRRDGTTQVPIAFDELTIRADDVPKDKVGAMTKAIFAIVDELDVDEDQGRGFGAMADNELRTNWLMNVLVHERFKQVDRDAIYTEAMSTASPGWTATFASRCMGYFEGEDERRRNGEPIVSEAVARTFDAMAVERLKASAADRSLISIRSFPSLLWQWKRRTSAEEVREWTDQELVNDDSVIALANALTNVGWTFGMGLGDMGDRVSRASPRVNTKIYAEIVDVQRLEARVAEVAARTDLTPRQRQIIELFQTAPRGDHNRDEPEDDTEEPVIEAKIDEDAED